MPKFMFAYHGGGMPETPEEGAKAMAAWQAWYGGIGDKLADGGAPVGKSQTVTPDGSVVDNGGSNPLSGYTVVDVADAAEACDLAKGCPILADGGSVEVAPIIDM